jgi:hypothetical protein
MPCQTGSGAAAVQEVKNENVGNQTLKSDVDYDLPNLPEAPVFYPTTEEFADPIQYLNSIREEAQAAGIIKIVPPKEWRCPFPIKENGDSFHFQTCVQSVDQLRHRHGPGTKFMQRLRHFHRTRGLHLPAEVLSSCCSSCMHACSRFLRHCHARSCCGNT